MISKSSLTRLTVKRQEERFLSILLLLLLLLSDFIFAGDWQRIGPVTGSILSIAADRKNPTLWYSINATHNWFTSQVFSRLYRSTDNGESWLRTSVTGARSVLVDPSTSDVFVITYDAENAAYPLWRSIDHGRTFSLQSGSGPQKLFFHPSNPKVMFGIGPWFPWRLAVSSDRGRRWNPITTLPVNPEELNVDGEFSSYTLEDLLVSPFDGQTVYASGTITFKTGPRDSEEYPALLRSRNLGNSWVIDEFASYSFHYDSAFPDRAFAVDSYISYSYRAPKMKYLTAKGWRFLAYQTATEVVVVPGLQNQLYAHGWNPVDGSDVHFMSEDSGRTWRKIRLGPADSIHTLVARQSPEGSLLGGTSGGGLYLIQADRTFLPISRGFDEATLSAVAHSMGSPLVYTISSGSGGGSYLYRSENSGRSWRNITENFRNLAKNAGEMFVDPTDATRLFVSTGDWMLASQDAGNTWKRINIKGLSGAYFHPVHANEVYFTSDFRKIYRSTDDGFTIELLPMKLEYYSYVTDLQFDRFTDRMYIATDLGLYISDDRGMSAQAIGPEQHGRCGMECWIAGLVQLSGPGQFLISSASGLSKTEDGGATWEIISAKTYGKPILADQQGHHLYTIANKLLESTDGGKTWENITGEVDLKLTGDRPVSGMTDPRRHPWFVSTRSGLYQNLNGRDSWP